MGLRLDCDVCNGFIKNVAIKDLKNLDPKGEVCGTCRGKMDVLAKELDKMKKRYDQEIHKMISGAKREMTDLITKLANLIPDSEDKGFGG